MYNRYWQDGTNTCTFEYHCWLAEQNYRCLTWQLMQNPQVGIIWWVSSRKVSFDLLMEDRKTGWTVSDSVQETKRAGKAEQESTNEGEYFIVFLLNKCCCDLIQTCARLPTWCGSRRSIWSLHFLQLQTWSRRRRGLFFYQNWHHCHHHHCKYGQGWGVFLIFTSSQTL